MLGLGPGASDEAVRAAFRRLVKTTHPDRGGDPARFRRVLEAYRLLCAETQAGPAQGQGSKAGSKAGAKAGAQGGTRSGAQSGAKAGFKRESKPEPAPEPRGPGVLRISVIEAFLGAEKSIRLIDGRSGRVKLPPGLRSGDIARFGPGGEDRVIVSIIPEPDVEVRGDDLWMNVPVTQAFLKDGGRLEVATPLGRRALWISRTSASRGLFRTPGEGLPATDGHPRGHLYLRLVPDEALADTRSKSLLRRFTASWAA